MNQQQIAEAIHDTLLQALAGNADGALQHLEHLALSLGPRGMYGVCCALATAGAKGLAALHGPLPAGDMYVITERGPGALQARPAEAFASRFLVAYANGDLTMTRALYEAALRAGIDSYTESVQELLATVTGVIRLATDQRAAS